MRLKREATGTAAMTKSTKAATMRIRDSVTCNVSLQLNHGALISWAGTVGMSGRGRGGSTLIFSGWQGWQAGGAWRFAAATFAADRSANVPAKHVAALRAYRPSYFLQCHGVSFGGRCFQ